MQSHSPITSYNVQLSFFSGPLDLLLHLVHQKEVPVSQVNMVEICEQYLDIVTKASLLDLDKATEYLVIATTLVAIKSQMLLPNPKVEEEEVADEAFDPRFFEELRDKLKAYELTKKRAEQLAQSAQLGVDTFNRKPTQEFSSEVIYDYPDETADTLCETLLKLLKRIGANVSSFCVRLEPVSVVSYMMKVLDKFGSKQELGDRSSFYRVLCAIIKDEPKQLQNKKGPIIGGLIAILELVRRGIMAVEQKDEMSDFNISLKSSEQELKNIELTSEFDSEERLAVNS